MENQPAEWVKKEKLPEVTRSFHNYMLRDVYQDFAATTVQVCDTPYEKETVEQMLSVAYEFPSGFNREFAEERIRVAEGLFDPTMIKVS